MVVGGDHIRDDLIHGDRIQDHAGAGWPRNTFPSRFPLVRIDHVFHSPDVNVRRVVVPRTRWTRVASDHLPVVVEVSLP